ncbi:tachykinins isoform X2 [Belonocnema kinseyi]|uniref:tachykinins isoform X2 n=1 Tax=Belonocnema kinseyi TaxID=2817044 RepID=UPI00143DC1A1|nr:tachykinins isoform X2 [Belonocnema kinseyi]
MFAGPIVFAVFIVTSSFAEESASNDVAQEKRAPMGFQGMRGKKDLLSSENDEYSKRAPMGFQGMRGKKTISDENFSKRGPMGFHGMRGKKSFEEILEDIEKRALMGFHGMRGKKSYTFDYPEEYEKRSLAMGFQGVRGKREELTEDWGKRAPMGFQGMRGKKNSLDDVQELHKRAIMGFQGMRGKRSVENSYGSTSDSTKRASLSLQGSLRDRGESAPYYFKKLSPFRYFGIRGKKNPRWGIRGKFVGVRGKKWKASPYEDRIQLKKLFDNIERLNRLSGSSSVLEMQ